MACSFIFGGKMGCSKSGKSENGTKKVVGERRKSHQNLSSVAHCCLHCCTMYISCWNFSLFSTLSLHFLSTSDDLLFSAWTDHVRLGGWCCCVIVGAVDWAPGRTYRMPSCTKLLTLTEKQARTEARNAEYGIVKFTQGWLLVRPILWYAWSQLL